MIRIAGVDLPEEKRVDIGLTYIYGIGRSNVAPILKDAGIEASRRIKSLTAEEVNRIAKIIDKGYAVEGDLRRTVSENIKRLKEIGSYRGTRHTKNLPVRGQRTRSNARTKRGKRVTIGAIKKDERVRLAEKGVAAPVSEEKK